MAIDVKKIEIKSVSDASGLDEWISSGDVQADEIVAVIGKTEGNGGVNDFTRILSDQAFRKVLLNRGSRNDIDIKEIPMVWSGGCDGIITPHAVAFARNDQVGPDDKDRLVMGTAMSQELLPEDIGRRAWLRRLPWQLEMPWLMRILKIPKMYTMSRRRHLCSRLRQCRMPILATKRLPAKFTILWVFQMVLLRLVLVLHWKK